jgi:hypothetical protein
MKVLADASSTDTRIFGIPQFVKYAFDALTVAE